MRKRLTAFAGTVRRIVRSVFRPWVVARDFQAVADDYFEALHWLDEYCLHRAVYLKGRGGKWRLVVEATHDLPSLCVDGGSPLEVIQEFRRQQANAPDQARLQPSPEAGGSASELTSQPERPLADRYNELLYAVARKFPGESRHETALRYIRQAEEVHAGPCMQNK